jgi:hypothetical protein
MIYIATDPLELDLIRSQADICMVAKQLFDCFDPYTVFFRLRCLEVGDAVV